jgi:signal transduction histidine kinase
MSAVAAGPPSGPHGRRSVSTLAVTAIVWLGLATVAGIVFAGIVVIGGRVLGERELRTGLMIVAAVVLALVLDPVRVALTRVANRLVYGNRVSPWEAASRLADEMARPRTPEELLESLAQSIRAGTDADLVVVRLRVGGDTVPIVEVPEAGRRGELGDGVPAIAVPIRQDGEILGSIEVYPSERTGLGPVERRMVDDLASKASIVSRNAQLRERLRQRLDVARRQQVVLARARARTVEVQDEERRQLERDIHDTCQQRAVALAGRVGLAVSAAGTAPATAVGLIDEAILDVERLRTSLDRFAGRGGHTEVLVKGVAAAIRAESDGLPVPVEVIDGLRRRFPANLEDCLYFCCLEGIQNAVRHADASRVTVRLAEVEGTLRFGVSDDGKGFDLARASDGTGLVNIRQRVEAAGGSIAITSTGEGTEVAGRLPLITLPRLP